MTKMTKMKVMKTKEDVEEVWLQRGQSKCVGEMRE